MNPYLKAQRDKYEELRKSIEGLQTRAAEAGRDLTEDELRSIKDMGEQAKTLHTQIQDLSDIELRNAKVAELATQITTATAGAGDNDSGSEGDDDAGKGGDQTRATRLGGATTKDRDPGHYTRSSKLSFFGDLYKSRVFADEVAARRLIEHTRALDTTTEGVGVVPPKWLTEEFEMLARQGRALASAVRNIPLGDDPRPLTLPKQITGVTTAVAEQANENDSLADLDQWDSDVDVVSPKPTAGKQTVSRQMLDMSNPAIDQLIYGDLIGEYNRQIEVKVGNAVIAGAGTAAVTFANEAGFDAQDAAIDSVTDLSLAVRDARKLPATLLAMRTRRWGKFKKLKDTSGRPLIPSGSGGPMNVFGVGSVQTDGVIEDLPVIVTEGLGTTVYPESYVALRSNETLLFESNMLRFRFEEQAGPESVVLGIWGYTAVIVRQGGRSTKRAQITAEI